MIELLPVCLCGEKLKRFTDESQIECFSCKQLYLSFEESND